MIRDARMQQLVAAEKEPITPFISKVREWCDSCENENQKESKTQRSVTHNNHGRWRTAAAACEHQEQLL